MQNIPSSKFPSLTYLELYNKLSREFSSGKTEISIPGLSLNITSVRVHSNGANVLPGAKKYFCPQHNVNFPKECLAENLFNPAEPSVINTPDSEIACNKDFNFILMDEPGNRISKSVIILFHGLNEKRWDKYLPWAYALLKNTGKPVILFPLAFHMDRVPVEWSSPRFMSKTANARAKDTASNSHTSFVNAAISSRLESLPERFFWTGLQSFIDITELLNLIQAGKVKGIAADSEIDIFAYSIGAYFSLILMMSGGGGILNNSRLFAFCGGATLDRMYPISKYILDAKASAAINSFFLEQLNNGFRCSSRLEHYMSALHKDESYFMTMLLYHHNKELREQKLKKMENRISALALVKDFVVPPAEVLNTLKGEYRNININVDILDFPYEYNHVTPFPLQDKIEDKVNEAFKIVMKKAASFLE